MDIERYLECWSGRMAADVLSMSEVQLEAVFLGGIFKSTSLKTRLFLGYPAELPEAWISRHELHLSTV